MASKIILAFIIATHPCTGTSEISPFLDKYEANDFLRRERRSNRGGFFEEFKAGNQERECIEERCTLEEATEVFDNIQKGAEFYQKYGYCRAYVNVQSNRPTSGSEARPRPRGREWNNQLMRECLADTDDCNPFPCIRSNTLNCVDGVNSFDCVCKQGFTGNKCQGAINECLSNPCGNFGTCEDELGGFSCSCDDAHEGVLCENEISDCRIWGCGLYGSCRPDGPAGEYMCVCRPGYKGSTCSEDIDECEESNPCDQHCTNTHGSYSCSCSPGFLLDIDTRQKCNDIDECLETSHGCQHFCSNTAGSFMCRCKKGYALDSLYSRYCEDVNECLDDNGGCPIIESGCGLGRTPCETCSNRDGSFVCFCPPGFSRYEPGEPCVDIDECSVGEGRSCSQQCENYPGGFRCLCEDGYKVGYDGKRCIDINECIGDHGCEYRCSNLPGGYECTCKRGYLLSEDQRGCDDVDECLNGDHRCSHNCVNNEGSYECSCRSGYRSIGKYGCSDINECLSGPCGMNGRCVNEVGHFRCECSDGYSGELCDVGSNLCEPNPCHNGGECHTDISSFTCACTPGFEGEHCQNEIAMSCSEGFRLDGRACVDEDECASNPCAPHRCVNTEGSYSCECNAGFELIGNECRDVDECLAAPPTCQVCHNNPGSFECECSEGYRLNRDGQCEQTPVQPRVQQPPQLCASSGFPVGTVEDYVLLGSKKSDYATQQIGKLSKSFLLEFEFRTYDRDGLILAITNFPHSERYIYIIEQDGKLFFGANIDGTHMTTQDAKSPGHSNANGNWHKITIRKRKNSLRILHDGHKLKEMRSTRDRFTATHIYYGGLPETISIHGISPSDTDVFLQGCYRNIEPRGLQISWSEEQNSSHSECFENIESGTYFDGTGYLLTDVSAEPAVRMRFMLKAYSAIGRIVTIEDREGNIFTLDIDGNKVIATLENTRGRHSVTYIKPGGGVLCDNIWHVCDFSVSQSKILLHVDGLAAQDRDTSRMEAFTFGSDQLLTLGGHKDPAVTSFTGSLRRIKFNNRPFDLGGAREIVGVRTHSIPAT